MRALLLACLLACQPRPALPVLGAMADFSLTDQRGAPVKDEDLKGKVQIVDFIFTSCPDTCPVLTTKMSSLQAKIPSPKVGFVSFTVDPERDTPAALDAWATRYHADPARWRFLTGDVAQLKAVVASMMLAAEKTEVQPDGTYNVVHSEKFVLLDATGSIRGFYSSDEEGLDNLARDASALAD